MTYGIKRGLDDVDDDDVVTIPKKTKIPQTYPFNGFGSGPPVKPEDLNQTIMSLQEQQKRQETLARLKEWISDNNNTFSLDNGELLQEKKDIEKKIEQAKEQFEKDIAPVQKEIGLLESKISKFNQDHGRSIRSFLNKDSGFGFC